MCLCFILEGTRENCQSRLEHSLPLWSWEKWKKQPCVARDQLLALPTGWGKYWLSLVAFSAEQEVLAPLLGSFAKMENWQFSQSSHINAVPAAIVLDKRLRWQHGAPLNKVLHMDSQQGVPFLALPDALTQLDSLFHLGKCSRRLCVVVVVVV